MALPFFFADFIPEPGTPLTLEESTSKHINQVLRMTKGEQLYLTDGKGKKATVSITEQSKKNCVVQVTDQTISAITQPPVAIAISLLKNSARFEWFLEKATELGVSEIIVLLCQRTERSHFRLDRMKNIMISAMLQSQQCWLPQLSEPVAFKQWLSSASYPNKYIAHCLETEKHHLTPVSTTDTGTVICIGPEGDFSNEEIEQALALNYKPVTLGYTRLRTETAGIAAAALLRIQ